MRSPDPSFLSKQSRHRSDNLGCRLLMMPLAVLLATMTVNGATWTVDDDRLQNPDAHFLTIQDAIDQAADGDLITIWPGTYVGTGTDPLTGLPNPVMRLENRTLDVEGLEIDGKIVIIDGEDERRGIQCEVHGADVHQVSLTGLHVTRGVGVQFSDIPSIPIETLYPECGGALLAYQVGLHVESCQFNASHAHWGGAAACYKSNVNMTHCQFSDNHSNDWAGALGIGKFSNVLMQECHFESNTAIRGGAISTTASISLDGDMDCNCEWNSGNGNCDPEQLCLYECDLDENPACTDCDSDPIQCAGMLGGTWLINCTLTGNSAQVQGGAICIGGSVESNYPGDPRGYLFDCTLKDNSAGAVGGGIWAFSPTHLLISRCDFINNQADVCIGSGNGVGGGAIGIQGAEYARITDCLLEGNSTHQDGGGIYAIQSNLRVLGTQFVDNWAQGNECEGGGVFISDAWWTSMQDCFFTGNSASRRGGAISTGSSLADLFTINNTRFEKNRAQHEIELACSPCNDCWDEDPIYCQCDGGPGNGGWDIAQNVQGGAIYHLGSSMTLEHCCFIDNKAVSTLVDDSQTTDLFSGGNAEGGAVYREEYQSLIILDCDFSGNNVIPYCHSSSGVCGEAAGGAIYDSDQIDWDQKMLSVQDSTFCENSPSHIDGIIVDESDFDSDMFLDSCFCDGDVNKDGNVNVNDVLAVINAWDSTASDADLDGDGDVDVNDLLIVIENWNQCELELICSSDV
ncbi:MAG: dockerin type I domain-containing protein [Phycisphaerales bacterium]|nr:dockerin type I domain-containing protein [Phycisphaerales bacterium]